MKKTQIQAILTFLAFAALAALPLALGGCASFDRSIGVSYQTANGDTFGVNLGAPRGYSK